MEGENFISLKGYIAWPSLKKVGENNLSLFKGKIVIPIDNKKQYVKIAAWGDLAEGLDALPKDAFIHIHGHLEESNYEASCRHCGALDKKYWTEVVIDNFVRLS